MRKDLNSVAHRLLEDGKELEAKDDGPVDWRTKAGVFWDKFANIGSSEGMDITGYSKGIQEEFKGQVQTSATDDSFKWFKPDNEGKITKDNFLGSYEMAYKFVSVSSEL